MGFLELHVTIEQYSRKESSKNSLKNSLNLNLWISLMSRQLLQMARSLAETVDDIEGRTKVKMSCHRWRLYLKTYVKTSYKYAHTYTVLVLQDGAIGLDTVHALYPLGIDRIVDCGLNIYLRGRMASVIMPLQMNSQFGFPSTLITIRGANKNSARSDDQLRRISCAFIQSIYTVGTNVVLFHLTSV